jgi:hypothetical protein
MDGKPIAKLQRWWIRQWWRLTPRTYRADIKVTLLCAAGSWQEKGFQREAEIAWERVDQIP